MILIIQKHTLNYLILLYAKSNRNYCEKNKQNNNYIMVSFSADPFNYPMPGRRDLMSLSTIGQGDAFKVTTK